MPCTLMTLKLKDGSEARAFVCTRGARTPSAAPQLPCVVCGKPHTRLCDGEPGNWPNIKASGKTCSAPLCNAHAYHAGPNTDYCPRCRANARQHRNFGSPAQRGRIDAMKDAKHTNPTTKGE